MYAVAIRGAHSSVSWRKRHDLTKKCEKISDLFNQLIKKYSLKDVVELIFETEKINKKKIYQICLELKKNEENN